MTDKEIRIASTELAREVLKIAVDRAKRMEDPERIRRVQKEYAAFMLKYHRMIVRCS